MQRNRSVGRWVAMCMVGTAVAIGCATTAGEETIAQKSDAGKAADSAKRPADTNAATVDSTVVETMSDAAGGVRDAAFAKDSGAMNPDSGPLQPFAGEPFDPEPDLAVGAACTGENELTKRRCGACGIQESICTKQTDGSLKLAAYFACRDEVTGPTACLPNAARTGASCGLCGTLEETCSVLTGPNKCRWTSSCENETGSCKAGDVKHAKLDCDPQGIEVRKQVCTETCGWGPFEACATFAPDVLTMPTPGNTTSTTVKFWPLERNRLVPGTCPAAVSSAQGTVHYATLTNAEAEPVKVSISQAISGASTEYTTMLAVYAGTTVPATEAAAAACSGVVVDACGAAGCTSTSTTKWASLSGDNAVTIPAGGSIVVYSSAKNTGAGGKPFVLKVARKSLPEAPVEVPDVAGGTAARDIRILGSDGLVRRPVVSFGSRSMCPTSSYLPFVAARVVPVYNPGSEAVLITVGASGTSNVVVSAHEAMPVDATVGNCLVEVSDTCPDAAFVNQGCVRDVSVPAGGTIYVQVAGTFEFLSSGSSTLIVKRK